VTGRDPFTVEVQWHSPDQHYAAGFIRDGQPWILDGALVGFGATHGAAVDELVAIAAVLVAEGRNFLTDVPLPLPDRRWLADLLNPAGGLGMHDALRAAELAELAAGVPARPAVN
jgi:hypothetical protein